MSASSLSILPLTDLPEIRSGADLAAQIATTLAPWEPRAGDIIVVAQKIVSKSEGRVRRLSDVQVSAEARELAEQTRKDPAVVQLILNESAHIVKTWPGTIIVEDNRGLVMANAGIDQSNTHGDGEAILLPEDPDASAQMLAKRLSERFDVALGVIVSDSFGRPWRRGVLGVAIGASGCEVLSDIRGQVDRRGRELAATEVAIGDALAAAAVLVMGEADEGVPAALIRGWKSPSRVGSGKDLQRPPSQDQFR